VIWVMSMNPRPVTFSPHHWCNTWFGRSKQVFLYHPIFMIFISLD
jgi:hypothetical protein